MSLPKAFDVSRCRVIKPRLYRILATSLLYKNHCLNVDSEKRCGRNRLGPVEAILALLVYQLTKGELGVSLTHNRASSRGSEQRHPMTGAGWH